VYDTCRICRAPVWQYSPGGHPYCEAHYRLAERRAREREGVDREALYWRDDPVFGGQNSQRCVDAFFLRDTVRVLVSGLTRTAKTRAEAVLQQLEDACASGYEQAKIDAALRAYEALPAGLQRRGGR
jgi:hypothetical protein